MKMSYCQSQGHTGHFIGQTENPFKIIRIDKHLDFSDSRFSRHQLFKKSHFSEKRVPEKRNQTGPTCFLPFSLYHHPSPLRQFQNKIKYYACVKKIELSGLENQSIQF
jgi:hypothetical protein